MLVGPNIKTNNGEESMSEVAGTGSTNATGNDLGGTTAPEVLRAVDGAPTDGDGAKGAQTFLDRVGSALADLTEVIVVTAVGDVTVHMVSRNTTVSTTIDDSVLNGNSIVTVVKLIDGDVTTVIADALSLTQI